MESNWLTPWGKCSNNLGKRWQQSWQTQSKQFVSQSSNHRIRMSHKLTMMIFLSWIKGNIFKSPVEQTESFSREIICICTRPPSLLSTWIKRFKYFYCSVSGTTNWLKCSMKLSPNIKYQLATTLLLLWAGIQGWYDMNGKWNVKMNALRGYVDFPWSSFPFFLQTK